MKIIISAQTFVVEDKDHFYNVMVPGPDDLGQGEKIAPQVWLETDDGNIKVDKETRENILNFILSHIGKLTN